MKRLLMVSILAIVLVFVFTFSACADAWACRSCGQTGNTGKFCPNCGSAKPDESWVCPVCGRKLTTNFCDQDGTKRTDGSSSAATVKVGDHITFGHYPQTTSGTDNTPIEWRVLDVQGDKALVISEYGLDAQLYNTEDVDITWEQCTLRAWLNGEFLKKAFSSAEQGAILTTKVDNSKKQHYDWRQQSWGKDSTTYKDYADTEDKIFLLSYAEAHEYFGVNYWEDDEAKGYPNKASRVEPTAYAIAQGAFSNGKYKTSSGKAAGWWWLRSPGSISSYASSVHAGGSLFLYYVYFADGVVRPALWLNLNAAGGMNITIAKATPTPKGTPTPKPTPTPTPTPKPTPTPTPKSLSVKVGDHLTFGHYPQTTKDGSDNTPIKWRVLDVQGNKALVISEYGLDAKPYNTEFVDITWKDCTLRAWMNGDFLKKAFSSAEQGAIQTTRVDNSKSQHYSGYSGTYKNYADTEDKVFLLSYAEANRYFGVRYYKESGATDNIDSRVEPTAYAIAHNVYTNSDYKTSSGKAAGWWWLRSPGGSSGDASYVCTDGSLDDDLVFNTSRAVRPALWLDLNSALQ